MRRLACTWTKGCGVDTLRQACRNTAAAACLVCNTLTRPILQRWCRLPYEVAAWLLEFGPCDRGETSEPGMLAGSMSKQPGHLLLAVCFRAACAAGGGGNGMSSRAVMCGLAHSIPHTLVHANQHPTRPARSLRPVHPVAGAAAAGGGGRAAGSAGGPGVAAAAGGRLSALHGCQPALGGAVCGRQPAAP